jgi:hypothetical protein
MNDFLVLVGDSKDHLRESAQSAGNHAPRLARSLARGHTGVVQKLRIAPEPAAYAQRSCAAVRAFLRPFKGNSPTTVGWESGTVRRPARQLSRARYTHHDGGTGGRMESERQQSWIALKRRHAAFAAPFLKGYFIWTVTALLRTLQVLRHALTESRIVPKCSNHARNCLA